MAAVKAAMVTEAMVDRAMAASAPAGISRGLMRTALEAALREPEAPPVPPAMETAGEAVYDAFCGERREHGVMLPYADIYRAMRRLEPTSEPAPVVRCERMVFDDGTQHRRRGDVPR